MNVLIEEGFKKIRYVWERVSHNEGHHPDKNSSFIRLTRTIRSQRPEMIRTTLSCMVGSHLTIHSCEAVSRRATQSRTALSRRATKSRTALSRRAIQIHMAKVKLDHRPRSQPDQSRSFSSREGGAKFQTIVNCGTLARKIWCSASS